MGAQIEGGLELIFLIKVPRFGVGACLGGGLELLLGMVARPSDLTY
jgi:hypothetical protein